MGSRGLKNPSSITGPHFGFLLHLPTEWALRLPSAFAALSAAIAISWIAAKFYGPSALRLTDPPIFAPLLSPRASLESDLLAPPRQTCSSAPSLHLRWLRLRQFSSAPTRSTGTVAALIVVVVVRAGIVVVAVLLLFVIFGSRSFGFAGCNLGLAVRSSVAAMVGAGGRVESAGERASRSGGATLVPSSCSLRSTLYL